MVVLFVLNQHCSQLSECAYCLAAAPKHDFVHSTLEKACVAAGSDCQA